MNSRTGQRAPKRIVLAVTSPGSLSLLAGFPKYLAEHGWDVHVICSDPPAVPSSPWSLHSLSMRRDPSPTKDLLALYRWLMKLRRIRPTIVVAGTPKAGLLGMLSARLLNVPVRVYLLRGLRLETEAGIRRKLLAALERLTAASATHVQSVSHSLSEQFAGMRLAPPHKISVIGQGSSNGVEVGNSTHQSRESTSAVYRTVGFVGRIHPDKGLITLLEGVKMLRESGLPVRLLLVGGEEPPGYLDECLSSATLNRSSVTWVGRVTDVKRFIVDMDVLSLPSMREGFPNVVLEAAAQGVPAVASDVTGCRDAVVDGVTGLLHPAGDAEALAVALGQLLRDDAQRRKMGINAQQRVFRNFSRRTVWARTESYYFDLIKRSSIGDRIA